MRKLFLIPITIMIYLYLSVIYAKHFLADIYYVQSKKEVSSGNFNVALKDINSSISLNPDEPSYLRQKARIMILGLSNYDNEIIIVEKKKQILNLLEKSLSLNPLNLTTLRNNVPLYYFLAVHNLNETVSEENFDDIYKKAAIKYFQDLKSIYPSDLGILADIAEKEKKLYEWDAFEQSYDLARALREDVVIWHPSFIIPNLKPSL